MDRQYLGKAGSDRSANARPHRGSPLTLCEGTVTFSCSGETETLIPKGSINFGNDRCFESDGNTDNENEKQDGKTISATFRDSCCISKQNATEQCHSCQPMSEDTEYQSPPSVSPPTVSPSQSEECFKCSSETGTDMLEVTMEELG